MTYLLLGMSAIVINLFEISNSIFNPNYFAIIILSLCIIICVFGFNPFMDSKICKLIGDYDGVNIIENILIISQTISITFFVPFAISSLVGNPNEGRALLQDRMDILGSFGLLNTFAGSASHLFTISIVLAFRRISSKVNINYCAYRANLLFIASLSYIFYILAYIGRDGIVYWLMSFIAIFAIFRNHIESRIKHRFLHKAAIMLIIMMIPFSYITISRFTDSDITVFSSLFEYFGGQLNNFSDYYSIENRPLTQGYQNFPIFSDWWCKVFGEECSSWVSMHDEVFQVYLDQGKPPWLFATFISDFISDFGLLGMIVIILIFSIISYLTCKSKRQYSLSRLLLILFLFMIPYWGVFYFRFSIINGYILINLLFIFVVYIVEKFYSKKVKTNIVF